MSITYQPTSSPTFTLPDLNRWWGCLSLSWREARPVVQLMFQLRFLTAAALAAGGLAVATDADVTAGALARVPLAALAWLCVTWNIYLLNGINDLPEDRRNGSARPLAAGRLPLTAARRIAGGLAVAGVALAAAHSWPMVVVVAAMLGVGWLYSSGPRPQKANMAGFVAVVTAGGVLTYLAGALSVGLPAAPAGIWLPLVVLGLAMSFWMSLAGTTKDLSDVAGDRAAGRRTLPILLGDHAARQLMGVLAIGVGVTLLAASLAFAPVLLPAGVALTAGGGVVAALLIAPVAGTTRAALRRPYRAFMVSQYAVHGLVLAQCVA
ncbi:UbiA family prenyltransferase [Luedemannella flava]|uniref:UbiA family prenyltransferase n=1 Tax=Luedemannella flava TaxID=349316 RepID=A0ABN2LU47_9ACTN